MAEEALLTEEGAKLSFCLRIDYKIHPRDSRSEPEAQLGTLSLSLSLEQLESYANTRRFKETFDESAISLSSVPVTKRRLILADVTIFRDILFPTR